MSAGILQSGGLRLCSYPLDWGQSGSSVLLDLFELDPEACYWRHFHQPNLSYRQILTTSSSTDQSYIKICPVDVLYGFPYFYNPHREMGNSKSYFLRCLSRFKSVVSNASVTKLFFSPRG